MDRWEEARIERLERKVETLERKNWERSFFWMRVLMYGMVIAAWTLAAITIALHVSRHS